MAIVRRLIVALVIATLAAAATCFLAIQWGGCLYVIEGARGIDEGPRALVRVCHLTSEGLVATLVVFLVTATALWLSLSARAKPSHDDQAG